jgi:hypothetical protein
MRRRFLACCVGLFLMLGNGLGPIGEAQAAKARKSRPPLESVIVKLSDGSMPSRASVERILGVKLKPMKKDRIAIPNPHFTTYVSSARLLADARLVEVELRVAKPGAVVTAGPLLILSVDDRSKQCVDRATALETYGPLELSQTPKGHSVNEQTSYSRTTSWGKFSIGFAERSPDCLASVVFDHNLPDA